jgi:hypothetical protein
MQILFHICLFNRAFVIPGTKGERKVRDWKRGKQMWSVFIERPLSCIVYRLSFIGILMGETGFSPGRAERKGLQLKKEVVFVYC